MARHFGWPVSLRVDLPEGATVEKTDSSVIITATDKLTVVHTVDEVDFVSRLTALRGRLWREATERLTRPK